MEVQPMKKSSIITICAIVFLLVAGLIIAYNVSIHIPKNPSSASGNTQGNLNSGGMFCENDGIIYFANPYDNYSLYSMNSDCSNPKQISPDHCSYINVYDRFIYYVKDNTSYSSTLLSGEPYGIIRCKLNGSHYEPLHKNFSNDLSLSGNTLIFNSPAEGKMVTYSVNIDGSNMKVISERDVPNTSFTGNEIYYSNPTSETLANHYIYKMNIEDGQSVPCLDANTYMTNYINGVLYYIDLDNNYALTAYNTSTRAKRIITNERVVLYNIYENVIFYQEETGDHSVKRIYLDGTNPVMIMPGDVSNIGCTSKYTFFKKLDEDSLYVTETFSGSGVEKLIIQ